jgi:hypothetical protein
MRKLDRSDLVESGRERGVVLMDRGRVAAALFTLIVGLSVLVMAVLTGGLTPSVNADDSLALDTCARALPAASFYGIVWGVDRGQRTTAADVVRWQEGRLTHFAITSDYRRLPPTSSVTVCLYDGEFDTPEGPPPTDGSVRPMPNRLRLIILADGSANLDSAGYAGHIAPELPSDLP